MKRLTTLLVFLIGICTQAQTITQCTGEVRLSDRDFSRIDGLDYGDIDNDGDEDIVASTDDGVIWYEQVGPGIYAEKEQLFDTFGGQSINLHDIDGDELLDILSFRYGSIYWYRNMGNATFADKVSIGTGFYTTSNADFKDLNGDGFIDVAFVGAEVFMDETGIVQDAFFEIKTYMNNGSGSFSNSQEYFGFFDNAFFTPFFDASPHIQASDVDFDGDIDLVCVITEFNSFGDDVRGVKLINSGDMTFENEEDFITENFAFFDDFHLIDIDQDGLEDVLFERSLKWLRNDPDEFFQSMGFLIDAPASVFEMIDLNQDGLEDILRLNGTGCHFHENLGASEFADPVLISELPSGRLLDVNLNGDGQVDLILAENYAGIHLLEQDDLQFEGIQVDRRGVKFISAMQLLDLEGDGDKDIICARDDEQGISVFQNEGLGVFGEQIELESVPSHLKALHIAHLDGDDLEDLIYYDESRIGFLLNNGDLTFSDPVETVLPDDKVLSVFVDDINGNGQLDLGLGCHHSVQLFIDFVSGGFNENLFILETDSSELTTTIEAVDFDNDGDQDIFIYQDDPRNYSWFKNMGNSSFEEISILENSYNGTIQILDYNDDGDQDILVVTSSAVAHFENDDSGQFVLETDQANLGFVYDEVEVIDIDGDGWKDLFLSGNYYPAWSRGGPNGFQTRRLLSNLSYNNDEGNAHLHDLDLDGDLDLVAANLGMELVRWNENMPGIPLANYSFTSENSCQGNQFDWANSSVAYYPHSTWAWDFGDGSGSQDLYTSHSYEEPGSYEVSFSICNPVGCDTLTQVIEVVTVIDFVIPSEGVVGEEIQFLDSSVNITNWTWLFGDDSDSVEQSPVYIYDEPGVYQVELYLTNNQTLDCTFYRTAEIEVFPADPGSNISNEISQDIAVYPNPFVSDLEIVWSQEKDCEYTVFNQLGEQVSSGILSGSKIELPENLASGLYFLQLQNTDGQAIFDQAIVKSP